MRDVLRLVRFPNLALAAAGVLAGGWIAAGRIAWPAPLLWAALSGIGLGAAGNVLNDLWDEPADRANARSDRPLAAGRLARGVAHLAVLWGTLLGLGAAALVSGIEAAAALAALGVMAVYSPVLKRRGVLGNVAVGVVAGFPLEFGALAVGRAAAGLVPWVLAAWIHVVREIVKDIDDLTGDRAAGRRTIAVVSGPAVAARVAAVAGLAFVPVSIALPWAARYGGWYFAVAAAAQLVMLGLARRLARGAARGASGWLKAAMVIGVVALVLGRVA